MGMFVNPGNGAFQAALNTEIYVDKTGLLEYTNRVMDTTQAFICNSRPRRFGKSMTVDMLTAYYSRGCDSEEMFQGTLIAGKDLFRKHLNKYDVIRIDVQWFFQPRKKEGTLVQRIERSVVAELREYYPEELGDWEVSLAEALALIHKMSGIKFIVIMDEWDVLIREQAENTKQQKEYIDFLRSLFKGSYPAEFLHLAYLTGILPIKKLQAQSALNNFEEFTMLDAKIFAPFVGFTEDEVKKLCEKYGRDFEEVRRWYDGYLLSDYHVYNPKAVVSVMLWGGFQSYWSQTGTYESILPLINMDFDGLRGAVLSMLAGNCAGVKTTSYQNDMISFRNKNDVLTALIHLGYLAYNQKNKTAFIPNEELRIEFEEAVSGTQWNEFLDFQRKSKELLEAILEMDAAAVAKGIEEIHEEFISAIQYNDENSLSSVLSIAYLGAMQYYFMPLREMPGGKGFADYVFVPKPEYAGRMPALLVELKWNKKAETGIQQIKDRNYVQAVKGYTGDILLVGISYDKKSKKHECVIEEYRNS